MIDFFQNKKTDNRITINFFIFDFQHQHIQKRKKKMKTLPPFFLSIHSILKEDE